MDAAALHDKALALARAAHNGQLDKAGAPYIGHPLRVAARGRNEAERIVGLLHDVVEDAGLTLDALRAQGFPEALVAAVDALSRREAESYGAFIRRAAQNEIARAVKVYDLEDNLDPARIAKPDTRDIARAAKYRKALARLRRIDAEKAAGV